MEPLSRLPRMEVEVKDLTFRFYTRHENHYDSSFQMFVDGDSGHIHTLNGRNFFSHFKEFHRELFLIPCVRFVCFHMMDDTLRALKIVADDLVYIEEWPVEEIHGRQFFRVRMSLKSDNWSERKNKSPLAKVLAVYGDKIYELS